MESIISLKKSRENMQDFTEKVKGKCSFFVFKKSQSIFKISPIEEENWQKVIDFTEIKKGGVDIKDLLKRL